MKCPTHRPGLGLLAEGRLVRGYLTAVTLLATFLPARKA